jgi:excisionase family DNA binding protein
MEKETGEIKLIKKVYTVKELAEVLSIGLNKAYNLVNDGDIRSLKVKSSIRIPVSEVERYLNQDQRVKTINLHERNLSTPVHGL